MKFVVMLLALLTLSSSAFKANWPPHPFYVSITEFEIKQDTVQIALRMFTEDLEDILNDKGTEQIYLQEPSKYARNTVHIKDYLFEHFKVGDGAGNLSIEWIGHEFEDDVIWVYGQAPISSEQRLIFVRNSVITDLYESQKNMVHYMHNGEIETKLASKKQPEVRFTRK